MSPRVREQMRCIVCWPISGDLEKKFAASIWAVWGPWSSMGPVIRESHPTHALRLSYEGYGAKNIPRVSATFSHCCGKPINLKLHEHARRTATPWQSQKHPKYIVILDTQVAVCLLCKLSPQSARVEWLTESDLLSILSILSFKSSVTQ